MDLRFLPLVFGLLLLPDWSLAAEEGLINLDKSLVIQTVNFVLLLLILWRFLYRPFLSKMEERSQLIKKSLDEAQAARAEAQRLQAEYLARLEAAHAEAQAIRETALREAAEEHRRIVEAARQDAARTVDAARAEIEQDVRRARAELRQEVAGLAIELAEQLIRRSLRDEDHRRIVQESIARLERIG